MNDLYIYVFPERAKYSHEEPSNADLVLVRQFELQVLRVKAIDDELVVEELDPSGSWVPAEESSYFMIHGQAWHE